MAFEKFFSGITKKREKMKEMEEDVKIQRMVEQKMKSSNERELERFERDEREKAIKEKLEHFRKKQRREMFSGGMLKSPDLFDHSPTLLKEDKNVLANNNQFLGRGNMI
jgi:hypothetical protein